MIKQFQENKQFKSNKVDFTENWKEQMKGLCHLMQRKQHGFGEGNLETEVNHNEQALWMKDVDDKLCGLKQNNITITKEDVVQHLKSAPDWKGAGPDYWLKHLL